MRILQAVDDSRMSGCPILAASLFLRLGWDSTPPFRTGRIQSAVFLAILFSSLVLQVPPSLAQSPAQASPPTGSVASSSLFRIAGTVVNSASGEPVRHATVAVLSEEDSHTIAAVESDGDGHFSLDRLPAAKYQLTVSKRGFRTAFFDEHKNYNSAVVTGPEQDTANITFRLDPGAVLHGAVTTDGGDPVEGARVLLFLKFHDGKPAARILQSDATTTDDTEPTSSAASPRAITCWLWLPSRGMRCITPPAAKTC
jgi:hypothetical protein